MTMIWFLTCGLTFLHIWLMPSKAMLAPPVNLSVTLLDFVATVEWLPGPGSPPGTKYTLEFITAPKISGGHWNQSSKCTEIAKLKCDLTFDPQSDEVFWQYFVKVKAVFNGTNSSWAQMSNKSFQPYGDTCLSAPEVNISTDQQGISIHFSHKMQLQPGLEQLRFFLYLYENISAEMSKFVAQTSASESPHVFRDVPPGRTYCVNVSASHQKASQRNNINATECFFLSDSPGHLSVEIMWIVPLILLIILGFGVVLTCTCFYNKMYKIKDLRIPKTLLVIPGTKSFLKFSPEKFHTVTSTGQTAALNTEDCVSESEEDNTLLYYQRNSHTNITINSSSVSSQDTSVHFPCNVEEAKRCLYRNEMDSDEEEENTSDFMHVDNMHLDAGVPCTSNLLLFTSEEPQIRTVNIRQEGDYNEETEGEMCSELSDSCFALSGKEKDDDVSSWTHSPSGLDYEPRGI